MYECNVEVSEDPNTCETIITVSGMMCEEASHLFRPQILRLRYAQPLVIDLGGVTYFDDVAAGVLTAVARRRSRHVEGFEPLRIVNPGEALQRIERTQLYRFIKVEGHEDDYTGFAKT